MNGIASDESAITIRLRHPDDDPGIRALHDRTPPDGFGERNLPPPWPSDLDHIAEHYLAFWVAITNQSGPEEIVGMVGVAVPGPDIPDQILLGIGSLAVRLKRMRVAPECQRKGLGSRLVDAVIDWASERRASEIILDTTTLQAGAIALYRHKGFTEIGRSQLGSYELVWLKLPVGRTHDEATQPGEGAS